MKKVIIGAMIVSVGFIIALTSCSSKIGGTIEGKTYKTEEWVDGDTFRLMSRCSWERWKEKNRIMREESAKRCAINYAQYQIIEKFIGSKIEGASGMENFEMTGIAISQELKAVIRGGSVVNYRCNEDEMGCELIYEVKARGLKKRVESGDFKVKQ